MKRKRSYAKGKPQKPSVVPPNDAFQNVGWSNSNHNNLDDFDNPAFDSSNIIAQQAGLEKQVSNERTEDNVNSLRKRNLAVSDDLSKKSGTIATKSSRGFGSSKIKLISKAPQMQSESTHQEQLRLPHQDPKYNEAELNASLAVIKTIMKMDAAAPFNIPVNPIALGIPDYFDVIDTPMDFGTICNNLENGLKYMNSEDVFKDVQYIWDNCSKYNKRGDYILELMKRVKTHFMKYWASADLHQKHPQAISGHLHVLSPVKSTTMRDSKQGKACQLVPVRDNHSYQQLDEMSPSPVQSDQSSIFSQGYQAQMSSDQEQLSPEEPETNICTAADSANKKRRGRGPTRCLEVWNTAGKISISTNELGQPIGLEAPKLANFLGTLARDGHMAPLTYVDWRAMPDEKKENMWKQVESKFDIDPKSKSWVMDSLAKKWRNWKCMLKSAHYNTHETDEERLADRDERVLPDQWSYLISYWNSSEGEKRSATNKAIRAQQKFSHTTGTKSFARLREEQKAKRRDGKEPTWAELFILTRTRKDGQPVNEASSAIISQLRECEPQQLEPSQSPKPQDEILSQVMGRGRYDRMLTYGLGRMESRKPTRDEAIKMVSEANAEVHEMKERMVAMEQTCAQMAAQMATMMSMMSSIHSSAPEMCVPNAVAESSHVPEDLPPQPVRSSRRHHEGPSRETRAIRRGNKQNASTSKVTRSLIPDM